MRVFTVINQKGGCGKTTTAINLSSAFAHAGCRTLLVDLDPQSHCAAGLGVPEDRLDLDVSDAMRMPVDQELNRDRLIWHVGRNLDLLPSRMKLAGIEAAKGGLADQENKELRLRSVLQRLTRRIGKSAEGDDAQYDPTNPPSLYDVCVIDCPPSIGLLSYNAIAAGREVIIPVETSFFSLRGAAKQVQTARSIARRIGMRIQPRLLATMHDPSQPLARDLLDDLRDRFGAGMIPVVVRYDHALKEAASFGQAVDEYNPESMGAEDYRSVCEWLVEHAHVDRPEPDEDDAGGGDAFGGIKRAPTLASASIEIASSNKGEALSRAQELAIRARVMQQQSTKGPSEPALDASTSTRGTGGGVGVASKGGQILKRSLMPHRPIAIELVDDRVVKPAGVDVTRVRHLFGIRRSSKGILFVQPASVGRRVEVAGDFNGWKPQATQMILNEALGVYEKHVELPKGVYSYKLVIDGQWINDPYNSAKAENGLGGYNNMITIE